MGEWNGSQRHSLGRQDVVVALVFVIQIILFAKGKTEVEKGRKSHKENGEREEVLDKDGDEPKEEEERGERNTGKPPPTP